MILFKSKTFSALRVYELSDSSSEKQSGYRVKKLLQVLQESTLSLGGQTFFRNGYNRVVVEHFLLMKLSVAAWS